MYYTKPLHYNTVPPPPPHCFGSFLQLEPFWPGNSGSCSFNASGGYQIGKECCREQQCVTLVWLSFLLPQCGWCDPKAERNPTVCGVPGGKQLQCASPGPEERWPGHDSSSSLIHCAWCGTLCWWVLGEWVGWWANCHGDLRESLLQEPAAWSSLYVLQGSSHHLFPH